MTNKGVILMTALPPTKGHMQLIQFAQQYLYSAFGPYSCELHVLIYGTPNEPIAAYQRAAWLSRDIGLGRLIWTTIKSYEGTLPDKPEDHEDFWGLWQSFLLKTLGPFNKNDIIFSSEEYGKAVAKVLECQHVPYDIGRDTIRAKASNVRHNPLLFFEDLAPSVQKTFQKTVTIFGAESTGKTTLAKSLAMQYGGNLGYYLPEWARPYLESLMEKTRCSNCDGHGIVSHYTIDGSDFLGPKECSDCRGSGVEFVGGETTDERMEVIVHGQRAIEQTAKTLTAKPFIIRDTDLLSTVGYYGIYSKYTPPVVAINKADLYIVCPSDIPFTPDPLRYGGNSRESEDRYWIDLLEKYECNYVVLTEKTRERRMQEAYRHMEELFMQHPVWGYER